MAGNLEKVFERINRAIGQKVAKGEREVARRYAKTLAEIRALTAEFYERYEQGGILTYEEMAKFDRLRKYQKEVTGMLGRLYKDLLRIITEILGGVYEEGYYLTAWAIETDVKAKLAYSSVTSETILAMVNNPISGLTLKQRLEKNRADIISRIQQEVTQGLVRGDTYSTMAKRLKGSLEGDATKATRIVRTEAHRAQESAKHDAAVHANKQGVIMLKEWNSLEDERVRHKLTANHRALNGKKVPVDELFKQGTGKGPGPGLMGSPEHDINCRCFLTYTVDRVDKPQHDFLQDMPFEQWSKERIKKA